ncbi:uncharacterized protein [Rutidosis leptorrhynchoides]|uniref:uncharacterized protein n=1 Tax=Rutidosis leptorrhynchoides TaxID=125765 RepID=UPI003A993DB9
MKVHLDTGSSVNIIYEQCFRKLPESIKAELISTAVSLSDFAGEFAWPLGQLALNIDLIDETDAKIMRQACLNLYVMRSASRYNMLLGRSALRQLRAVIENAGVEDYMVVIKRAYPEQTIKIGSNLNTDVKKQLVHLLIENMDVFAWCEQDMTGVPREIAEHKLNANPALKPIIQKHRGMAPDRMKWLCGEVTKLVKEGILQEVKYQTWVANPVLVKKPDRSWRMCIDVKDINKA